MHRLKIDDLSLYNISEEKPFEYDLVELSNKYLKPNLSKEKYRLVQQVIEKVANIGSSAPPLRLTHGDISPKHILWDAHNQKLGIIDFSDRSFADPALDFAELYKYGADFVDQVYELYSGPKDSEFLNRARIYQKRVGIYLMIDSYRNRKVSISEAQHIFESAMES